MGMKALGNENLDGVDEEGGIVSASEGARSAVVWVIVVVGKGVVVPLGGTPRDCSGVHLRNPIGMVRSVSMHVIM
jgi:hypothetical protein